MNSITRIKEFIKVCFPSWEKVDFSNFEKNIDFRNDLSELYKINDEEIVLISYTNISITGSDRAKPQLRVFLDEYKKPFYFAKKHQLRFFLFSIFTKDDSMAKGLDNFKPKEYIISIETNLDTEDSRRDLRSIYDYANEKINGRKFLKCTRNNYKADINQASFIYIGPPEAPEKDIFENFINVFDSRPYLNSKIDITNMNITNVSLKNKSRQQIFYGAPGTGKSRKIKDLTDSESVIRTTFHPDSDYSTFVGAYKPTMIEEDAKIVPVVINNGISLNQNNGTYKEKRISYKFVMQAFLKAYLGAWKKYADRNSDCVRPQFLVIEEINRGNCAQIFGDLFQLLDRGSNHFSEYPIEADTDLQQEIERAFKENNDYKLTNNINVEDILKDYTSNYGATLSEDIQHGRVLLLPSNLFIWATMNTSDQSLFPIDSAFKRRWDWVYTPIAQGKDENGEPMEWQIEGQGDNSWWKFIQGINEVIDITTHSEDKKLGFFFCKAQNDVIKQETFVNKVVFYLWNDVFKVYGFRSDIFDRKGKDDKTEKITFKSFYNDDGSVNEETISAFVKNVMAKVPKEEAKNEVQNENKETGEEGETEA